VLHLSSGELDTRRLMSSDTSSLSLAQERKREHMPTSHKWEVNIEGQYIEGTKAEIMKLQRSAQLAGKQADVYENGVLVTKKSGKREDIFKHEMFTALSLLSYGVSSLTREFDNGMTDLDLRDEIGGLVVRLNVLYEKVNARINEQSDTAIYGPEMPVEA